MPEIYHIYKRTITKNGKKITCYYYWFYDENHRQIRKTCGTNGNPCLTRKEALAYIATLSQNPMHSDLCTIRECVSDMFLPGSLYLTKRTAKGYGITEYTRQQKQHHLELFLDKFGSRETESVEVAEIEDWLLTLDRSNSWRNGVLQVIKEVYQELYNRHKIARIPLIQGFYRSKKSKKGILAPEEIKALFSPVYEENIKNWKRISSESDVEVYTIYAACYLMLSSGMRSGECRALQKKQFIEDDVILLNAAMSENRRLDILKKGNEDNKKWRIIVIPDAAVKTLDTLRKLQVDSRLESDYLFARNQKAVSKEFLNSRFQWVLGRNGIDYRERKLSIHSLRFTYNTIMKREIDAADLREIMGHTTENMTEYYDRSSIKDRIPGLMQNKGVINSVFSQ